MGMTIAEHIAQLKKLKSFHNGSYGASINFAIDTMRKYQKIQEIVTKWQSEPEMKFATSYYDIAKITEVLEDGKID